MWQCGGVAVVPLDRLTFQTIQPTNLPSQNQDPKVSLCQTFKQTRDENRYDTPPKPTKVPRFRMVSVTKCHTVDKHHDFR